MRALRPGVIAHTEYREQFREIGLQRRQILRRGLTTDDLREVISYAPLGIEVGRLGPVFAAPAHPLVFALPYRLAKAVDDIAAMLKQMDTA